MHSTKGDFGIAQQIRFALLSPSLYCIYLAFLSSLIVCLLKCEPMFKTLRAMFSLSVGEGKQSPFTLIYIFYIASKKNKKNQIKSNQIKIKAKIFYSRRRRSSRKTKRQNLILRNLNTWCNSR